jgi:hypothetical protein
MSCDECDKYQDEMKVAFYRWGRANIGIMACPTHAREVMDALNKIQEMDSNEP